MKAFAFSEHGNVFSWISKKAEIEARGMKYIHAMEAYVTESLDSKVRDNYHMIFIAKNYEGVKELNKLSSKSFEKDGHYYHDARFTIDEVMATSNNIMITTSCLGGILAKGRRLERWELIFKFLKFAKENKDRVFLEIQYHDHPEQIEHNQYLYQLAQEHGLSLIAGTDTHSLDERYARGRRILMQAKNIQFADEDKFDLTFKSYDEFVEMFKKQGSLPEQVYLDAIEFTNTMADMVEAFEIDKSPKYPKLHADSESEFQKAINEGYIKRGLSKKSKQAKEKYKKSITEEYEVYKKLDAIDYMLFQKDVVDEAQRRGIRQGYGRGSVNGSLIAYLLGITEIDSIKHRLNFFRFLNPDRMTLADIDIDWEPSRRDEVIAYVASKKEIYFSLIITFNTVGIKGAVREVGRALKIDLAIIDDIAKNVEDREEFYREKYPEIFEYVDIIIGVNVSVGGHASGYLVSPIPLDESIGLFYSADSQYPISQVNMKELEACFYVKLDILGLDNVEIINKTCDLAGIERLTPDNVDLQDEAVWKSIHESTLGIFQWESDSAFAYYKQLFSDDTLAKIKNQNPNISYIDLFSIGNGAIRPSGDSYRNNLARGIFKDNGHPAINEFLKDTIGYLVYQEQIMGWLVEFCGYSGRESDSVRRAISKKGGTEKLLPEIKKRFRQTMQNKYSIDEFNADKILYDILKVIQDAADYGFSLNHSNPYSIKGFVCAHLRHYHTLEFLTVMLNVKSSKKEKTGDIVAFAKSKGITISSIKFGKSRAEYSCSKSENTIFKGLESIKELSAKIAEELYALSQDKRYNTFVELLIDIKHHTTVNSAQLAILINLGYFSQFGSTGKLTAIVKEFAEGKFRYKKDHTEDTKHKRIPKLIEFEQNCPESENHNVLAQILYEKEYLGYVESKFPEYESSNRFGVILDIDEKYTPKLLVYVFKTGAEMTIKFSKRKYFDQFDNPTVFVGDIIKMHEVVMKFKVKNVDGKWVEQDTKEPHLESLILLHREEKEVTTNDTKQTAIH